MPGVRRVGLFLATALFVLIASVEAQAATGHVGKNTTANNARVEMDWFSNSSGPCPNGQYRRGTMTYWNASSSTLGFRTMEVNGTLYPRVDISAGDTSFRPGSTTCGTATIKTEVTRLSDGVKWCVALVQNNGSSATTGGCPGF